MAVIGGDDDTVGVRAQVAAESVVGCVVAQHPAAAVEIDGDGMRPRAVRPVQAVFDRTLCARECAVDHCADLRSRGIARVHRKRHGARLFG